RFAHFFGDTPMACLHSALSDGERMKAWLQARSGEARIIIGTRSAIFTPAPNLALIVIDEEHDASLKQQEGFRYHARDLAIKRAQMLNIPIVMGTATPSLESLYNADTARFHYVRLNQRPGTTRKPDLQIQDTRPFELQAGLTPHSLQAIRTTLARGEQVMVFLNRRGFAPALYCPSCGWQASCQHCSVKMTWHARRNKLVCHHCGAEQATPLRCPQCQNPQLTTQGQGTERLELALQTYFPAAVVVRIDRDSTSRKGELEAKLATVRSNDPLILVGTQMLAKGHDFPNLTLVIILDIDQSLLSTDYRALERLGQLLIQVAGRAGRADKAGRVILQTSQPDHPMLHQLVGHGYTPFARQLLEDRKRWHFPPFGYQALIRASSTASMEKALQFLEQISQLLIVTDGADIQRLGPIPALLEKRANRYRAQLLLGSQHRAALHAALLQLLNPSVKLPGRSGIRWSVDVDPIDFS
ncbi:MAG: primosomal protein N', partial [Thiothrix litoralis]